MLDSQDNKRDFLSKEKKALEVLTKIINSISAGSEAKKIFSDQDYVIFEVSKADPGLIIGKHGHTLDAIQYLVNMIVNQNTDKDNQKLYLVDIDGYRKRREESLKRFALEKAKIAKERGKVVALYFMNSIERRLIHLSLKDDPHINTHSEGVEPYRRVVISPLQKSPNLDSISKKANE
ncbi:MAG: KH domain-containing protein [Atribacterota bacterium]|nr:KH domain-containing protein [Atribacterota bacterium]MDD4764966.1 KH domain-containing protein [Atribacterota bacterium]MDD5635664.1 KH domain-containing protein [Atribacterota bacterium]MDI9597575.1 KH domain-containing protein [Atribacterota bacterium]